MESYDQLLEECKEVARDAEDMEAVERWLDCPADVEFICNACHEYLGGRLFVAVGGPAIYIDTRRQSVEGIWFADRVSVPCDADLVDKMLRNRWECF